MKKLTTTLAATFVGLSAGTFADAQQYTVETFDVPATPPRTEARAINGFGDVAGIAGGFGAPLTDRIFIRQADGTISRFDDPSSVNPSNVTGINNADTVVGFFEAGGAEGSTGGGTNTGEGWIRQVNGLITPVDLSGASTTTQTQLWGINNAGTTVGATIEQGSGNTDVFIRQADGTVTGNQIDTSLGMGLSLGGINDNEDISGVFGFSTANFTPLLFRKVNGVFESKDLGFDFFFVEVGGINDAGQVVGGATGINGTQPFLWEGGDLMILDIVIPDAANGIVATDINDAGQISGLYVDANFVNHAFVATPVPEPAAALLLGVGGLLLRRRA